MGSKWARNWWNRLLIFVHPKGNYTSVCNPCAGPGVGGEGEARARGRGGGAGPARHALPRSNRGRTAHPRYAPRRTVKSYWDVNIAMKDSGI